MSAQRYPEQFDGWVVGAPENDFTRELATELVLTQAQRQAGKSVTSAYLRVLADAVRKACDGNDGIEDGLIANPRSCSFDPHVLACQAGSTENCLPGDVLDSITAS